MVKHQEVLTTEEEEVMKNVRDVGYTECEKHRGESQNRGIQINDCSDDTMAVTFELVRGHFDKKFNLPKSSTLLPAGRTEYSLL